jgi:precorrin-3B C17-methyltransferase
VVGIGPGGASHRTAAAVAAIAQSQVIVGYSRYVKSIADLTAGKELIGSGMRQEVDRCRLALERTAGGAIVALISSGDAGIYGMAGLAIELAEAEGFAVPIEVVPGVTAASAAAAALGAPLMTDFAVISLSDLLVDWQVIRRRLEAVAQADMVVALYNPASSQRVEQFRQAVEIFRAHHPPGTPVGLVTAAGNLGHFQTDRKSVV